MNPDRTTDSAPARAPESRAPLWDHHRHLERVFDALATQAQGGDPVSLRTDWAAFESELERHLALEETDILPGFAREHPEEAAEIRREHAAIRQTLAGLGVDLDLHALRADAVASFLERLRAHARREDRLLYQWAEKHPPKSGWSIAKEALENLAGRLIP